MSRKNPSNEGETAETRGARQSSPGTGAPRREADEPAGTDAPTTALSTILPDSDTADSVEDGARRPPRFAPDMTSVLKKSDVVARLLVTEIVEDRLPPGSPLKTESVMQHELGVGRATVREALRILELHGLVHRTQGHKGGPYVGQATSRNFGRMSTLFYQMQGATFRELVEARRALEPVMARIAATRPVESTIEALKAAIELANEAHLEDDREWQRASVVFHEAIAGVSGNRILDLLGESLKDIWFDRAVGVVYVPEAREKVRSDHIAVAEAIIEGRPEDAERLMREHMEEFSLHVIESHRGLLSEVVEWK